MPFCPECNAPQIRVGAENASAPVPPGTPGEVQPPAEPVVPAPARPLQPVNWAKAVPAAATAGIVMALALLLPLAVFFLWMLVGGALAVAFYRRGNPQPISPREGARIGAVSGLLGFVLFAVGYSIMLLVGGGGGEFRQELMRRMQEMAARSSDPQAQQMVQKLMTPEALVFMIAIALLLFLIIFVVLSSLGGAAGAALFRERDSKRGNGRA